MVTGKNKNDSLPKMVEIYLAPSTSASNLTLNKPIVIETQTY